MARGRRVDRGQEDVALGGEVRGDGQGAGRGREAEGAEVRGGGDPVSDGLIALRGSNKAGEAQLYLAPDGKMMGVAVKAGAEFTAGTAAVLFQTPSGAIVGDMAADGKRFLFLTPVGASASTPFTVVLNWTALLKR